MFEREEALEALQRRLGHEFRRRGLLELALTHRSYAYEQGGLEHFERLEFLGDAVLGLVTCEWLYEQHPEMSEGDLSKRKAFMVSRKMLARFAEKLDLGSALLLGVGEDRSGGRYRRALLADGMEAVLGAVFLDGGLAAGREVAIPLLEAGAKEVAREPDRDAKTRFQEILQAQGAQLPEYRHVSQVGPDHRKWFVVECWVEGLRVGTGEGQTKKQAEQRAARAALEARRGLDNAEVQGTGNANDQ